MIALIIISCIILLSLIFFIVFGFLAFERSFTRKTYEGDPLKAAVNKVGNRPYSEGFVRGIYWFRDFENKEEVEIKSHDGLRLKGFYLKNKNSQGKVMILCHGYRSFPYFDFSASAKEYYDRGFDLLFIVQRSHGESEGDYITFGCKERLDLIRWIDFVNERHHNNAKIILAGVSMGASTVMYALGENLPTSVKGALCDCGFDSPKNIIAFALIEVFKNKFLARFMSKFVSLAALFKNGAFLGTINTKKSLKNCKVPVMIAHGKADDVVPYEMGIKNFGYIKTEKFFVKSEKAAHGLVYFYENTEYLAAFDKLCEACGLNAVS